MKCFNQIKNVFSEHCKLKSKITALVDEASINIRCLYFGWSLGIITKIYCFVSFLKYYNVAKKLSDFY